VANCPSRYGPTTLMTEGCPPNPQRRKTPSMAKSNMNGASTASKRNIRRRAGLNAISPPAEDFAVGSGGCWAGRFIATVAEWRFLGKSAPVSKPRRTQRFSCIPLPYGRGSVRRLAYERPTRKGRRLFGAGTSMALIVIERHPRRAVQTRSPVKRKRPAPKSGAGRCCGCCLPNSPPHQVSNGSPGSKLPTDADARAPRHPSPAAPESPARARRCTRPGRRPRHRPNRQSADWDCPANPRRRRRHHRHW
jgi:hypothetical protein